MLLPLATPSPIAQGDEGTAVRRFDCEGYGGCLNLAAKARWASWSCSACSAFVACPRAEPELRRGCALSSSE